MHLNVRHVIIQQNISREGSGVIKRVVFVMLFVTLVLAEPYVSELLTDRIEAQYGPFAKNRFALLNKIMDDARGQSELRQLEIINDFYNSVPYLSDEKNYKSKDMFGGKKGKKNW